MYVEFKEHLSDDALRGLEMGWLIETGSPFFDPELYSVVTICIIPKLKEMPDNPEYFPQGKSATIQRLQELCEEVAQDAREKGFEI